MYIKNQNNFEFILLGLLQESLFLGILIVVSSFTSILCTILILFNTTLD